MRVRMRQARLPEEGLRVSRLFQDRRGRRIATLLLLGTFCLVALLLFELGVRWLEPQPVEPYRFSPHTYYEPVPNADFVYARSEFRVPVRFNRFGMRDQERSLQKGANVRRIALLGDSFAEALQVPQDSMVSQRLESHLRSCLPGKTTEVLNFGVSGYGPAASAARYASLARRFEPDVVVYLFVRNDPWDLVQQDSRLYAIRNDRLVLQPLQPGWFSHQLRACIDFGKHHFHAQRFLKYRMVRWRDGSQQAAAAEEARMGDGELRPGDAAWDRVRQALALLEELARDDGASFLVA